MQSIDNLDVDNDAFFNGVVVAYAAVNGGMISNFGRRVVEKVVKDGAEVHFFASKLPVFGFLPPVEELESIGGEFHGLPLSEHFAPLREIWSLLLMAVMLRKLNVQVLHTRSSIMGAVGRIAGRLAGVPVIVHHQDDLVCRDNRLSTWKGKLVAFIECRLARIGHHSFFISQAVLDDAIAIGFPPKRCTLVGMDLHNVFAESITQSPISIEKMQQKFRSWGIAASAKVVGCVGRLAHIKGIDLLLKAIDAIILDFPEWVFLIKGNGPLRTSIQEEIEQRGLQKQVFLVTEELDMMQLPAFYHNIDLFVLPTRREGFGMVFVEAMVMGVPVIGPNIGPVNDIIQNEKGFLFEAENVDDLAKVLRKVMSDDTLRVTTAKYGQKYAIERWNGDLAASKVVAVYRDLLNKR
jgi:glycosyltransferase involved in cell wall biosynthesis